MEWKQINVPSLSKTTNRGRSRSRSSTTSGCRPPKNDAADEVLQPPLTSPKEDVGEFDADGNGEGHVEDEAEEAEEEVEVAEEGEAFVESSGDRVTC